MAVNLYDHQLRAIEMLKSGSILQGGVGSGKTLTALSYFFMKECGGKIAINKNRGWSPIKNPKKLYVITTAHKRDTKDWENEAKIFKLPYMVVDSWNNVHKYIHVKDAFFIFDEQRIVGHGLWVKSFLRIAERNRWILLTATPGDTWIDYIPVFIANGFYKNRTEFIRRHVVYNRFSKFPKIDRYLEVKRLIRLRNSIIVQMHFQRQTVTHDMDIFCDYDKDSFDHARIDRWNIFTNLPIRDIAELCFVLRRIVNTHKSRLTKLYDIYKIHSKIILFYNFNYELDLLIDFCKLYDIPCTQWNGHKHEELLDSDEWIHLVQYTAGCEGWNCIQTNCIIFFSQNYSYKTTVQAAGRIDRLNTPFSDLYYYHFLSNSIIDLAIKRALRNKQDFNEYQYTSL